MNTVFFRSSLVAFAAASALGSTVRPASACGGCFQRPAESTVVTDHRMAFSISTRQTVLWDQIKYAGNPTDFSWVLPVHPGAVLELSHDEWFAALDAMTVPTISAPPQNCNSGGGGGCGARDTSSPSAGFAAAGHGSVQIISQSVVGPYETVTLRSTDAHALETWLTANGYALPDSIRPTIDAYVAAAFDFIALRLQPGQGVQSMQPVRVVTQGADATLPLRMVAAGVGAEVGVTLYVIGEGRYEAKPPFFNAVVNDAQLVWRQKDNRSNYQELSQQLMKQNRARTWLTEFSQVTLMASSGQSSLICTPTYYGPYGSQSLADLYLSQCRCAAPKACAVARPAGPSLDGADAAGATSDAAQASEAAAEASEPVEAAAEASEPPEAAADAPQAPDAFDSTEASDEASPGQDALADGHAAADGSSPAPDPSCTRAPCDGFDDLDRALVGLHPGDVWVTRLRAILPVDALSEGDLQLQASTPQNAVSNLHYTTRYDDPTYDPCGKGRSGCSETAREPDSFETWWAVGALGFVGVALARRRSS